MLSSVLMFELSLLLVPSDDITPSDSSAIAGNESDDEEDGNKAVADRCCLLELNINSGRKLPNVIHPLTVINDDTEGGLGNEYKYRKHTLRDAYIIAQLNKVNLPNKDEVLVVGDVPEGFCPSSLFVGSPAACSSRSSSSIPSSSGSKNGDESSGCSN